MKLKVIIFYIALLVLATSCKSLKQSSGDKIPETITNNNQETPQILTLVFEINANGSLQLINTMYSPGQLRNKPKQPVSANVGDLLVYFISSENESCQSILVANPLIKTVEYSDDYTTITAKTVFLDKAEFSVRVQYTECIQMLNIKQIIDKNGATSEVIFETQLNTNSNE